MEQLPLPSPRGPAARAQDIEYIVVDKAAEPEKTLQDYLSVLRRRKWWLMMPLLMVLPFLIMEKLTDKPQYQATATLLINKAQPNILSIEEVLKPEKSPDFYRTQFEIIRSRAIAAQVVDALRLYEKEPTPDPPLVQRINAIKAFPRQLVSRAVMAVRELIARFTGAEPVQEATGAALPADPLAWRRERAIDRLLWALQVFPREGTQLVDVTLRGEDPEDVAQQVNLLAETYVRRNLENKLDASRKAVAWLKKEAQALKDKIHRAELALQQFKEQNDFLAPENLNAAQHVVTREFEALQQAYVETVAARKALEARIDELRALARQDLARLASLDVLSHSLVPSLHRQYSELELRYAQLSQRYKEKHPQMVQVRAEMQKLREAIRAEVRRVLEGMQAEQRLLLAKEQALQRELDSQRQDVNRLSSRLTTYNELKRELEIEKDLYQAISKRLAETTLTMALETNNVEIVERAQVPRKPVSSGVTKRLALGVIAALGLGVGLAFLRDNLDKRFKTMGEAERALGLALLGMVPHYRVRRNRLVTLHDPWSTAAEAYRAIRTWIQLWAQGTQKASKVLLVTSALPGEGKSTTAANLAVAFARLGQRVLLVDADLRRPTLHRLLRAVSDKGLTDILAHGTAWEAVQQGTALEQLKFIATGKLPQHPAELLSSQRLDGLLATLSRAFDTVILDAPVTLSIPDVAILAPRVDGVVLVHCPGKAERAAVLEAKKVLERVGVQVLGVVFNNVRPREQRYFYYDYKYQYATYYPAVPADGQLPAPHQGPAPHPRVSGNTPS